MKNIKTIIAILSLFLPALFMINCATIGAVDVPVEQLKTKYADENSRFINIDGTNVHYRDEGKGPVLVLLHGACSSLQTWDGWVKELKGSYRIIRLDSPGFGLTGPLAGGKYEPEEFVVLFEKFVKALDLKKFYLAGNSLGGYISWLFTLKRPDMVDRLILVDPVGQKQDLPWIIGFASNPLIRPFARKMMPRFMIHMSVKQVFGDKTKATPETQARYFELAMREGNKSAWVDIFTVMKERCHMDSLSDGIKNIKRPTLIMWGTKDEWIPIALLENWKRDLPSASVITYEGAGHIPMEELPVETAKDANEFLSGK